MGSEEESAGAEHALDGVLLAVGGTPLVRLRRLFPDTPARLHAKLEGANPGGSAKDRPALHVLRCAIAEGRLRPGMVVVESSSGNFGVGLAQACGYLGYPLICVIDARTTPQNAAILRAYGARIETVTDPDPATGEFLPARLRRVRELVEALPGAFWPNQYENLDNAAAHHVTMREIVQSLGGRCDYLFCATSTCGTLRGCAEYCRANGLATRIVAVDAKGSAIFGGPTERRLVPGHGAAVRPGLFQADLADEVVLVSDLDCVMGCRRLARRESILAGGSSGGVVAAVERLLPALPAGADCVAILPDRGERYLDTIYSDEWVCEHLGAAALERLTGELTPV